MSSLNTTKRLILGSVHNRDEPIKRWGTPARIMVGAEAKSRSTDRWRISARLTPRTMRYATRQARTPRTRQTGNERVYSAFSSL